MIWMIYASCWIVWLFLVLYWRANRCEEVWGMTFSLDTWDNRGGTMRVRCRLLKDHDCECNFGSMGELWTI